MTTAGCTEDFQYLEHLVLLKRHVLLRVQFRLFAFEYRTTTGELSEHTSDRPAVHSGVVMLRAEQKLRRAVPDRDDDLVSAVEREQGLVRQTREAKIADFDDTGGGDEDVGRLEVAVEDVGLVQVEQAGEELVDERLEDSVRDLGAHGLRVVVDDLLWGQSETGGSGGKPRCGRHTRKSCSAYSNTM